MKYFEIDELKEIIDLLESAGLSPMLCDTHLTLTPKLKNRYHPLVAILFLSFLDKKKSNGEKVIRFFANLRIIDYLCSQNKNYHGCNV